MKLVDAEDLEFSVRFWSLDQWFPRHSVDNLVIVHVNREIALRVVNQVWGSVEYRVMEDWEPPRSFDLDRPQG